MLAIIPARAGSKGLPGKNKMMLKGKPLIAHTIEAALHSQFIKQIIVTTDDTDILDISNQYGVIPLHRPKDLSRDDSSIHDVIVHTIENYQKQKKRYPDHIILLQPTNPLRNQTHIDEAIERFFHHAVSSLVSVCKVQEHPYIMKQIISGKLVDYIPNRSAGNRQDFPPIYRLNGCIYIVETHAFLTHQRLHFKDTIPYIMNTEDSIDIDNKIDFLLADLLL